MFIQTSVQYNVNLVINWMFIMQLRKFRPKLKKKKKKNMSATKLPCKNVKSETEMTQIIHNSYMYFYDDIQYDIFMI